MFSFFLIQFIEFIVSNIRYYWFMFVVLVMNFDKVVSQILLYVYIYLMIYFFILYVIIV